jgi:hypothetical protein
MSWVDSLAAGSVDAARPPPPAPALPHPSHPHRRPSRGRHPMRSARFLPPRHRRAARRPCQSGGAPPKPPLAGSRWQAPGAGRLGKFVEPRNRGLARKCSALSQRRIFWVPLFPLSWQGGAAWVFPLSSTDQDPAPGFVPARSCCRRKLLCPPARVWSKLLRGIRKGFLPARSWLPAMACVPLAWDHKLCVCVGGGGGETKRQDGMTAGQRTLAS